MSHEYQKADDCSDELGKIITNTSRHQSPSLLPTHSERATSSWRQQIHDVLHSHYRENVCGVRSCLSKPVSNEAHTMDMQRDTSIFMVDSFALTSSLSLVCCTHCTMALKRHCALLIVLKPQCKTKRSFTIEQDNTSGCVMLCEGL